MWPLGRCDRNRSIRLCISVVYSLITDMEINITKQVLKLSRFLSYKILLVLKCQSIQLMNGIFFFSFYEELNNTYKLRVFSISNNPRSSLKQEFIVYSFGVSDWFLLYANSAIAISRWEQVNVQCPLCTRPTRLVACLPTRTHYPDSEPTSLCSFFLMLRA
jgi:hypothetical protein